MEENTQKEFRYDFGAIPKREAIRMWRCDILTGELKKVKLEKEKRKTIVTSKKDGAIKMGGEVNFYWIMTKSNYFYLPAKDIYDAVEKFEAQFKDAEDQLIKREAEKCLKKV